MAKNNGHEVHFWTTKEAANYLRISVSQMFFYGRIPRSKGGPPVYRILKNKIRYPREEFIKWVESRKN